MASGTTRRRVIIGAALALSPPGTSTATTILMADAGTDQDLIVLGLQLQRLRRRVQALHRNMRTINETDAWQRWSEAHAELTGFCDRIVRMPASTMAGLAVRYEALAVGLLDDGVLMDDGIRRQVLALRREMRRLASSATRRASHA